MADATNGQRQIRIRFRRPLAGRSESPEQNTDRMKQLAHANRRRVSREAGSDEQAQLFERVQILAVPARERARMVDRELDRLGEHAMSSATKN